MPQGHPEAEVQSIFSRYGQLRSIQRIFGSSEEDDKGKSLDPDSESSPTTGTEESAFRIEYFNIQDARLAASELCATSAQLLGPDAVVSFSPLDSRKQQLCRQLLATLSRWRSELSSSSSLSSHANMNLRGVGGMGLGLGMFSASSGSLSYQMPMMGSHQQQTFPGMYGTSGGGGGVLVDTNLNMGGQQYPMNMSMQMGMIPYGVPVQVPYHNNITQPPQQQLQSGQRNFDLNSNVQRQNTSNDKFRMGSASDGQSVVNAGGDIGNFTSKERENRSQNNQGQQQSAHGYESQDGKSGSNSGWGAVSNPNTRNMSYNDKPNTFQTDDGDFGQQQRHQYPVYGTSSNMQSPHQFIQQQQQAYRSKVQSNQIIGQQQQQLQQQQYSYQQQTAGGSTDFYGQSHRPHHHNGGHGQQMQGAYAQWGLGGQSQQGPMQGRRMVKGNNPTGTHSYSGGIGGVSSANNGSSTQGSVNSGGDFSQIDFSLDISRVDEGEDLRTTVMVR